MTEQRKNVLLLPAAAVLVIVALLLAPAGCGPAPVYVSSRGVEFWIESAEVPDFGAFEQSEADLFAALARVCPDVAGGSIDGVTARVVDLPEDEGCPVNAAACALPVARVVIVPPRYPDAFYGHELLHLLLKDVRGDVDRGHVSECQEAVDS